MILIHSVLWSKIIKMRILFCAFNVRSVSVKRLWVTLKKINVYMINASFNYIINWQNYCPFFSLADPGSFPLHSRFSIRSEIPKRLRKFNIISRNKRWKFFAKNDGWRLFVVGSRYPCIQYFRKCVRKFSYIFVLLLYNLSKGLNAFKSYAFFH